MSLPAEKAVAVVLRVVDFSESSSVVTLFTREFGKLGGLAKGARKPKGPFESALDLLSLCRVVFLPKPSGQLDLLTEAKLDRRFRPWAGELPRLYAAYYTAELLNLLTHEHDPFPELFDLTVSTLAALSSRAAGEPAAWILRWELGLLRVTGHLPTWTECVECAQPAPSEGRVTFGTYAGGLLCETCRAGQRGLIALDAHTPRVLDRFTRAGDPRDPEYATWTDNIIPRPLYGELRGLINHYLTHLLGERPRLHDWLHGITH